MEDKLTVGYAIPAKGPDYPQPQLMNAIKNIEKRLENIEKLLLEIQRQSAEASGIEKDESRK